MGKAVVLLAGTMYLAVLTPAAFACQFQPDTVLLHAVYAGEPLRNLMTGVAAIAKGAFSHEDAEAIQKQAWEQSASRSSDGERQIELRYAWYVQGRSQKKAVLAMYLLSTRAYQYDVRIQAADDGLMKAIRTHLAELKIDSLMPIDRMRLTLSEERASNTPPRLSLGLRTVREYGCLGYHLDHDIRQESYDTIFLNLHGVSPPGEVCATAMGPATLTRELTLLPRKYLLLVTYNGRTDRLILAISDTLIAVTGLDSSLVESNERPRWRYPANSFAFHCGNVNGGRSVCIDADNWLARQPGISRLSFGQGAINPYDPDPGSRPDEVVTFFRYDRQVSFERLRLCFGAVDNAIHEAVGVWLWVDDWRRVQISARSRKSFHQPHIENPERMSDIPACRTPAWSD